MVARRDVGLPDKADIWTRLAEPKDNWPTTEDLRERLDSVCPGEWDMTFEPLPARVLNADDMYLMKCRVQILGVIREGIGESANSKLAYQFAFREACLLFGIGREIPPEQW